MTAKKIVNVIPITYVARPHSSVFSYEITEELPAGALVWVPFGKRRLMGFVEGMQDPNLPPPPYLKPIISVISSKPVFPTPVLELIDWMAKFYITPKGLVIKTALGGFNTEEIGKNAEKMTGQNPETKKEKSRRISAYGPKRFKEYSKEISSVLAKEQNVLLLVPTNKQEADVAGKLNASVRKNIISLSSLDTKTQHSEWLKLYGAKKKILLGSKKAVFAPLENIGLIIVEDENNILYKTTLQQPKYNIKEAAEKLASLTGSVIFFGGEMPSTDNFYKTGAEKNILITDTSKKIKVNIENLSDRELRINNYRFSPALLDLAEETVKKNGRTIILSARKGEASGLICRDCGEMVLCPSCSAPLALYALKENETLICRHCGKEVAPPKTCPSCKGWRFRPMGLASNKIADYLSKFFRGAKIFIFDSSTVKTDKDKANIIKEFNDTPGSMLIATKMALTEDIKPVDLAVIPAVDQFLTIPNFQAQEMLMDMIIKLKTLIKTKGNLTIQTYHPEQKMFEDIRENNVMSFLNEELETRKELGWPPFTKLIKISARNKREEKVNQALSGLADKLSSVENAGFEVMGPYPAFIRKIKGEYIWHLLVKENAKTDEDLNTSLQERLQKMIPSIFDIDVNPESIL